MMMLWVGGLEFLLVFGIMMDVRVSWNDSYNYDAETQHMSSEFEV